MIVVIVHHWCKPDMVEAARERIDRNGDSMAQAPGFLFRCRMERVEEPLKISTVTTWTAEERYRTWQAEKNARDAAAGLPSPYERAISEMFPVTHAHAGNLRHAMLPI